MTDTLLSELLRFYYAQPVLTGFFCFAVLIVFSATITDIVFSLVRRITK